MSGSCVRSEKPITTISRDGRGHVAERGCDDLPACADSRESNVPEAACGDHHTHDHDHAHDHVAGRGHDGYSACACGAGHKHEGGAGGEDGCCEHDGCEHDGCCEGHEHEDGCCEQDGCCEHDGCEHDGCCEHDGDHHDDCCDHDGCCEHDGCACCCEGDEAFEERELAAAPSFSYHVIGIDCPNCARRLQNAVRMLPSVTDARLTYVNATIEVVAANEGALDECRREVLSCVRSCGQDLELTEEEVERLGATRPWYEERREQLLMGASGLALATGLGLDILREKPQLAIPLYVMAAVAGLAFIAPMALAALRRRTADMNVLMGIAVIGALVMGFLGDAEVFRDAAIVIFLDQVGEWLEGWSMRKTAGSIEELMNLTPDVAHVIDEAGRAADEPVAEVEEGQLIRILPGERVPLDGLIVQGASSFNEAPVTGESIPQDKAVGAQVFAGSLNTSAVVDIEVTADEDCTTIARIVSMVQGAQAEKAPYESFIDRFAAVYTPLVVVAALVVGLLVPALICLRGGFSQDVWHDWAYRALSLLVVACPCALVISTPVSFVSALTRAARMGVLVKGGAYFDIACRVSAAVFDKTGTLTTGAPSVTRVVACEDSTEDEVLRVACALEEASTHPLARAVSQAARERGVSAAVASQVEEVAANGMRGEIDGVVHVVGKLAFARANARVSDGVARTVEELGAEGASALVVCAGERVLGVVGVADAVRPEASEMVRALTAAGVERTMMLTGDNKHAASAVAGRLGLSDYAAELMPDDKVARVRGLQDEGRLVAMVGDGINDAPALVTADLGITMGAAASDTSLEVSDVALLADDLSSLPAFFELAHRTMHIVRENIAFAIGVKLLVFVLVIVGVAGMSAAVFADTGVALIVILNGLRLMLPSKLRW